MLISRTKEVETLRSAAERDEAQFIAVYGHRGVGKTYLVKEAFGNSFTFQHTGLAKGSKKEQIASFCDSLQHAGLKDFDVPSDWMGALELLKGLIEASNDERKVVFIDELSWMDKRQGRLIPALESFWNGWGSGRKDLLLIVCSSVTSWMMDKVIHDTGGLYDRLTAQIPLYPFTLAECEEYLEANGINMNRTDILKAYMICGGIPYYWSHMRHGLSLSQNIDAMFFAEDAPLKREFDFLYASLSEKPDGYIAIVKALGTERAGLRREEIVRLTGIDNTGNLTRKLNDLERCDFIRSYTCFGKRKRDTTYQLIDNFTLFHLRFLEQQPSYEHYWSNHPNTPTHDSWRQLAFERVCLQHVPQIKFRLGISGVLTEAHAWYCQADPEKGLLGSQSDLLIVRRDHVINVCELKYSSTEYTYTKRDDEGMRNRISDIQIATKTRYALHPTLVTTYGLQKTQYWGTVQSVITAEDLFARLN